MKVIQFIFSIHSVAATEKSMRAEPSPGFVVFESADSCRRQKREVPVLTAKVMARFTKLLPWRKSKVAQEKMEDQWPNFGRTVFICIVLIRRRTGFPKIHKHHPPSPVKRALGVLQSVLQLRPDGTLLVCIFARTSPAQLLRSQTVASCAVATRGNAHL